MQYILHDKEVEVIKSALKAHINQCKRALNDGYLSVEEEEKVIYKVTKMNDLLELFMD